jgi:hypothetical protein
MGKRIHREHSGRAIEEDGMQFHFGLVWRLSRSRRKITVDQEEDLCLVCGCCKFGWRRWC